jgi:hypothetical protein
MSTVHNCIETMVIPKPIAFWIVRAVPTISGGQAFAEIADSCGESAAALMPQIAQKISCNIRGTSLIHG